MSYSDNENEDWIKSLRWDVRSPDGNLIVDIETLRDTFPGWTDDQLRGLPSISRAPAAIRDALS